MGVKTRITQIMESVYKHRLEGLNIYSDKTIEIFLYILLFCLPFSKAILEISASFIILAWIIKRIFSCPLSLRRINLLGIVKLLSPVKTYLNIPIIVYVLATFLSVICSNKFGLSLKNFGTKNMEYIMLYFILVEFVLNKRKLKNIVIVMLVSAAMIGTDCIFQYYFGFDFLRFRPLEAERMTGSFQMPGDLAGYLGPLLCLSLSLSFLKLKKQIKYFLRIESIVLLGILFATFSRGAWIGLIAAVCFLGLLENRKIIYAIFVFLLIFSVIMPLVAQTVDNIFDRLKSIFALRDPSSLDRKAMWQVAIWMIRDKPIFGHGLSTFMGNFPRYGKDYYYLNLGIIPYAHNCYLQLAAETGLVGLASFLMLIGTFFIYSVSSLRKIKDKFHHALLAGICAGIVATLIHSAVDTNLYSLQLSVLFWIMLGLNAALQRNIVFEKARSQDS